MYCSLENERKFPSRNSEMSTKVSSGNPADLDIETRKYLDQKMLRKPWKQNFWTHLKTYVLGL